MSWYSKVFRGRMINSMQAEINVAEGKKQVNANIFKLGPNILSFIFHPGPNIFRWGLTFFHPDPNIVHLGQNIFHLGPDTGG